MTALPAKATNCLQKVILTVLIQESRHTPIMANVIDLIVLCSQLQIGFHREFNCNLCIYMCISRFEITTSKYIVIALALESVRSA